MRRNEEGAESAKGFASIYTAQLHKQPTVWFIFASAALESAGSRRRQTAGLSRKIIESGFQVHLAASATYSANPNRICEGPPGLNHSVMMQCAAHLSAAYDAALLLFLH